MKGFILWCAGLVKDHFLAIVLIGVMYFGLWGVCLELRSISSAIYSHEDAVQELTQEIVDTPDYVFQRLGDNLPSMFWAGEE